jgi:hypothetical protein
MTPEETATVLAKCAAVDRRTVGRADVLAWHEIIGHLDFGVGLEAVRRWYTHHRDWIMPSDVVELGNEIIRERRKAERERRALEAVQQAKAEYKAATDRTAEIAQFVASVRDGLEPGDSDALRYGHKRWRLNRERLRRVRTAEPNPHYDPLAQARLLAQEGDQP